MEVLIAYLLGLFAGGAGGAFDNDKIKVYGVGCNLIVKNLRQAEIYNFLRCVTILLVVFVFFWTIWTFLYKRKSYKY